MTASVIILALLGFGAWRDVATRSIPDSVSIVILAVGASIRLYDGWQALGTSLGVSLVLFICLLPFQARGLVGGADLKLLTALSVGLPPAGTYYLLTAVTLIGAVLAGLYIGLRLIVRLVGERPRPSNRHGAVALRVIAIEAWRIKKGAPLPYGIAIAAGATFVVLGHPGV